MKVIINNGKNKLTYPMINHKDFIEGSEVLYHSQWLDHDDYIIYKINNDRYLFTSWDHYFHYTTNNHYDDNNNYIINIKQTPYTMMFPPLFSDDYFYSDKGHFEKLSEKTDFIVYYYPSRWKLSFYKTHVDTIEDVNTIKNTITKLMKSDNNIRFNINDTANVILITVDENHYGHLKIINKLLNVLEELCDTYWDDVISFTEMAETLEFIKKIRNII